MRDHILKERIRKGKKTGKNLYFNDIIPYSTERRIMWRIKRKQKLGNKKKREAYLELAYPFMFEVANSLSFMNLYIHGEK